MEVIGKALMLNEIADSMHKYNTLSPAVVLRLFTSCPTIYAFTHNDSHIAELNRHNHYKRVHLSTLA